MTIAGYIRVSSKSQDFSSQKDAIERAATGRSESVAIWYAEKLSGKTTDRPELKRLREDVRAGRVKTVLVFKLDRVVRSGCADAFAFVAELRQAGCTLVATADNLVIRPDANDIVSETLVFALSLAAKLELVAKNDRIAAARLRVEAAGGAWGRPRRMTDEQVARAHAMREQGRSIRQIAVALKVPKATIGLALSRKVSSEAESA